MNKRNGGSPPQYQPPYRYEWVAQAQLKLNSQYLVKGLIDRGGFNLIYGPSGSGKSFFTADLAQHIAMGHEWRGRKVKRHFCAYVASEAGASILRRFIGWRNKTLGEAAEEIPLAVLVQGPNLRFKQQVEELKTQLLYMRDEIQVDLGMVIFDTLSRSMSGGDENKAEDMTEVVSAGDYLRDTFGCSNTFVHHSGKDIDRGARGHSSLFAAADCVLRIDNHIATLDKVRDGVSGEQFPFSLTQIDLGVDEDGEKVTTCMLNTAVSATPERRELKGLGKNQKPILEALRKLVADQGSRSPGTTAIPAGVLTVSFEALCQRMESQYPGRKPWEVKKRVGEAITGLSGAGHAGVHDDFLWLR